MLRILYNAGPGNAFETFRMWKHGERDLVTSHVSYSGQMLEACERHGAAALITCYHETGQEQAHGDISIVRRPDLSRGKSKLAYHQSVWQKAQQNIRDAIEFDANVVVIAEDTNPLHYAPLRRRGVRVVQALHTRLWADNAHLGIMQRMRLRMLAKAYSSGDTIVLSASDVVSRQVAEVARRATPPILEFLPLYYAEHFAELPPPVQKQGKIEVFFIGRVEENKGVLDLVEIGILLKERGVNFRFQVCGTGSSLDKMKQMVTDLDLSEQFLFHGWCDRDRLREVITDCHVSIIPTRSDFIEGFNHVTVEAVLAGRPAVVSAICPAVHYVGNAVKIVQADNIHGYVEALETLARDPEKLSQHTAACQDAGKRFLDPSLSFGSVLDEVFRACSESRQVRPRRIDPAAI